MTPNHVIACDFEFYNSPNQILFKNEAFTAPAATAARYPSADGATHDDKEKRKKGILNAPSALHQINEIIPPPP